MLKQLKEFLSRRLVTVTFYMKSGNKIVCDRVCDKFMLDTRGNEVIGIRTWKQHGARNTLNLMSLDLSQIEAFTLS